MGTAELSARASAGLRRFGPLLSAISVAALAAVIWRAGPAELARPLAGARLDLLACALLLTLSVELCKAARWLLLLGHPWKAFPRLLAILFTSRVLNALAPLRAGDLWRVVSAAKLEGRPAAVSAGSVVVEKLMDAAALGVVTVILLGYAGHSLGTLTVHLAIPIPAAIALALIAVAAIAFVVLRMPGPRQAHHEIVPESQPSLSPSPTPPLPHSPSLPLAPILSIRLHPVHPVRIPVHLRLPALRSLEHLGEPQRLAATLVLTVAAIGLGLAVNLVVLAALGLSPGLVLGAAMLVSAYASGVLPAAPGQIGVFELAVSGALVAAGLTPAPAVAAALALHLVILATLAVGALLALPLGEIRNRE